MAVKEPVLPISLVEEALIEGLKVLLSREILSVSFNKVDGAARTMICTLNPAYLPPIEVKEGVEKAVTAPKLSRNIKVFVIGEGWKSFNSDTLTSLSRPV